MVVWDGVTGLESANVVSMILNSEYSAWKAGMYVYYNMHDIPK